MADRIGVSRRWIQKPGTHKEHFDIAKAKRALALEAGALLVTRVELGRMVLERSNEGERGKRMTDRLLTEEDIIKHCSEDSEFCQLAVDTGTWAASETHRIISAQVHAVLDNAVKANNKDWRIRERIVSLRIQDDLVFAGILLPKPDDKEQADDAR